MLFHGLLPTTGSEIPNYTFPKKYGISPTFFTFDDLGSAGPGHIKMTLKMVPPAIYLKPFTTCRYVA